MNEISNELIFLQEKYAALAIESWLSHSLFTWSWWFLVFLFIIPWVLFFKFLDKNRRLQIWSFGLIVIIVTTFTDDLGSELGAWIYPIKFVPVGLLALPFDFSIIPVSLMLIYQYFKTWKTFSTALVIQAVVFAYIGEPISVWLGTVTYLKWYFMLSVFFYISTGQLARYIVQRWLKPLKE
jgi:hypothetical protein